MRPSSGVVSELYSFSRNSTLTVSSSGAGRSVQLFGHFGDLLEISWHELWTDLYVNCKFWFAGGNASPKKKYTLSADAPVFVPKFAMPQQYYQVL